MLRPRHHTYLHTLSSTTKPPTNIPLSLSLMEATSLLLLPHGSLRASPMHGKVGCVMKPRYPTSDKSMRLSSPVQAVMLRPKEAATPRKTATATVAATTRAYRDNWFDMLAIGHLSKNLQEASGLKNDNDGYESLIVATVAISRVFGVEKQCELVIQALQQAFPGFILTMIKMMMPPSRFAREYFAAFTTIFFPWLVGPCEVKESEVDGSKEKNVVYIPKCRFLESTNCVGMCTNLCKIPCQKFIQDSLGMDVYMSPNFEDMSCEMIFGQQPPEDDPALKQPCFQTQCIAKQDHGVNCSI